MIFTHTMDHSGDCPKKQIDCRHCLDDATLLAYLQGALDPGEALLVALHVALLPEAKKRLLALNQCAAAACEELAPVKMKCSAEEFFKNKCCDKPKVETKKSCDVPAPLQSWLGEGFDCKGWQDVAVGLAEKKLKLCHSRFQAKLLRAAAGAKIPAHRHKGEEITMVLRGSFHDGDKHYQTGQVSLHRNDSHAPYTTEECICFVLIEKQNFLTKFFPFWRP